MNTTNTTLIVCPAYSNVLPSPTQQLRKSVPALPPPLPMSVLEHPQVREGTRPLMKPPRVGTFRFSVYAALQSQPALRRSDIAKRVAEMRGVALDNQVIAAVGKALDNRWDHRLRRVGRGLFELTAADQSAAAMTGGVS